MNTNDMMGTLSNMDSTDPVMRKAVADFAAEINRVAAENRQSAREKPIHRIVETLGGKPYAVTGMKSVVVPLDQHHFNAKVAEDIVTGRAPVIYADEVADYLEDEETCVEAMLGTPRPMPCFDALWIEGCPWREDDLIDAALIAAKAQWVSLGGLVRLVKLYEDKEAMLAFQSVIEREGHVIVNEDKLPLYMVEVYVYTTGVSGEVFGPMFRVCYFLNGLYEVIRRRTDEHDTIKGFKDVPLTTNMPLCMPPMMQEARRNPRQDPRALDRYIESFTRDTAKVVTAMVTRVLGLLNCSNVEMVPDGKVPNLNPPRRARREGLAWIKYHVLKVKVGRNLVPIQPRRQEVTGRGVALHMVRGSFRDYSSSGLFGKLRGSKYAAVWCPPYLRGASEHGAVVKDYRLEPRESVEVEGTVEPDQGV